MRSFADLDICVGRVPFDVTSELRTVDTGRGMGAHYRNALPELLTTLAGRARVQSIEASSAMEGVVVADRIRAAEIIAGAATSLRNRNEQELAGYRGALDYLYQERWQPLTVGLLLHLHRLLFRYTGSPGGAFKAVDNLVVDRHPDGTQVTRFVPVSAAETPYFAGELVTRFSAAVIADRHHPVILVGLFALDLLVVHPFADGNGRVTRVLTNGLLEDAGYDVTRFVSLETLIAGSADAYYSTLLASTAGWHTGTHDPWPWLRYFVGVVGDSYRRFGEITAVAQTIGSKQDRVRQFVRERAAPVFQIADIRTALPGISDQTIRLALESLKKSGDLEAQAVGRGATWRKLR